MREVAKNYFSNCVEPKFNDSAIDKRIGNINSPTNKDKLLNPYKILEIPLLDDDKEIIDKRNSFLHGIAIYETNLDDDDAFQELWYVALRLNFLSNAIILKYIGHEGCIANLTGLLQTEYSKKSNQPKFREI